MDGLDYLGFLSMLAMIGAFFVGAAPVIRIAAPDANECQHVQITRYWGTVTIIDAVMCEGETFKFNGKELIHNVQE
jgi:hypothetical protein